MTNRRFVVFAIGFALVSALWACESKKTVARGSVQKEIMEKEFESYVACLNEHKIKKALSFLSDDFHLHFVDYDVLIDKKGMVDVLGWDKGVNGSVSYKQLVVETDSISGLFTEQNEFFELIGISEVKARITFSFDKAGLILRQTYQPLPDQPSSQEKMQPAVEWLRKNKPIELRKLYPENQIQFNLESGEMWLVLLREWKIATQNDKQ